MKINKIIFALVMGASIVACAQNKPAAEVKDIAPSKADIDSVSYLVGINFGSFLKSYDWGDLNQSQILKGMNDFVNAKGNMSDPDFTAQFKVDPNRMNDIFNNYLEKRHAMSSILAKSKEDKFLAENAEKEGVLTTESGLQYKIIEAGSELKPTAADSVWVKYKGTLPDGTVFDQTGEDAIMLTLEQVIPGWTEGLQLIGEGGKIELVIPSALGYGDREMGEIPANSPLRFEVELTKVGKVAVE